MVNDAVVGHFGRDSEICLRWPFSSFKVMGEPVHMKGPRETGWVRMVCLVDSILLKRESRFIRLPKFITLCIYRISWSRCWQFRRRAIANWRILYLVFVWFQINERTENCLTFLRLCKIAFSLLFFIQVLLLFDLNLSSSSAAKMFLFLGFTGLQSHMILRFHFNERRRQSLNLELSPTKVSSTNDCCTSFNYSITIVEVGLYIHIHFFWLQCLLSTSVAISWFVPLSRWRRAKFTHSP
jgi:hypothetical protein